MSGMVPVMTASPLFPSPAGVLVVPDPLVVWHLATCHRCSEFSIPFRAESEHERWAVQHAERTGHTVILSVEIDPGDGEPNVPGPRACVLRRDGALWSWVCTGCGHPMAAQQREHTGHETGLLALAEYRDHTCEDAQ